MSFLGRKSGSGHGAQGSGHRAQSTGHRARGTEHRAQSGSTKEHPELLIGTL
ncbi:MAG: hypothetical protein IPI69_08195 [Bacteroidales bacterium]|nr:hypothetical protein [Bacteroidales bacterium]